MLCTEMFVDVCAVCEFLGSKVRPRNLWVRLPWGSAFVVYCLGPDCSYIQQGFWCENRVQVCFCLDLIRGLFLFLSRAKNFCVGMVCMYFLGCTRTLCVWM